MHISPFIPYKLLLHRDRIFSSLKGELVYPVSVEIDLSNVCPHDCPFCSFGTSTSQGYRQQNWQTFPEPRIFTLLEELKSCGVKSVTFTGGGEPLVHRKAAEIFLKATALGLSWGLVTNGLLLPRVIDALSGATFVRISLDAGTPETHHKTHGLPVGQYQYDDIIDNIHAVREAYPLLTIGASFCLMDENFKEVYKAAKDVRDAGGSYLEVRPTFPTEWRGDGWGHALSDADGAKVEVDHARLHLDTSTFQVIGMAERFDALATPEKQYSKCRVGPLTTVIGATGAIYHCCVQRGQPSFEVGSIRHQSFQDAWKEVHSLRMADQIDVKRCPRCRYDGYNEIIEKGILDNRLHADFV